MSRRRSSAFALPRDRKARVARVVVPKDVVHFRFATADFVLEVVVEFFRPLHGTLRFFARVSEVEVGEGRIVGDSVEPLGLEYDALNVFLF